MARAVLAAWALRDELNRAAVRLSSDGDSQLIYFMLPTLAEPGDCAFDHNWDVQADCPVGLDDLARTAVLQVAARWDLEED